MGDPNNNFGCRYLREGGGPAWPLSIARQCFFFNVPEGVGVVPKTSSQLKQCIVLKALFQRNCMKLSILFFFVLSKYSKTLSLLSYCKHKSVNFIYLTHKT